MIIRLPHVSSLQIHVSRRPLKMLFHGHVSVWCGYFESLKTLSLHLESLQMLDNSDMNKILSHEWWRVPICRAVFLFEVSSSLLWRNL